MIRKDRLPELLAPAGTYKAMLAAVAAGADAVYLAGKSFGARAFAGNFDMSELERAVRYCHLHSVKVYVTVNTLLGDGELDALIEYLCELYKIGVDALIVADLGVMRIVRELLPDFELHASTQMSVHNTDGADAAYRLGAVRVVLARELSREDIAAVAEKSLAECEVFLHGALCVCHSGQCLFSSLVGGRSGNRGECAQPCRLPYKNGYPLSLSDLSLASHIRELCDTGVASLKIEGRMKSPEYVYRVTAIYRRLLDEYRAASRAELDELSRVFSRSGFTDGYFIKNHAAMLGRRREEDKSESRSIAEGVYLEERTPVRAEAKFRLGEPSELTLILGERRVTVYGDSPVPAESSPLTPDGVRARLSKMGATLLSLSPSDIALTLDEGVNLSPSKINELRRAAADATADTSRQMPEVKMLKKLDTPPATRAINTALFFKREVFDKLDEAALDGFDIKFLPLMSYKGASSFANGVYIPPVATDSEAGEIKTALRDAAAEGARYALVGNISHIGWAKDAGLIPIGDFRLNITNAQAAAAYCEMGIEYGIASAELTLQGLSRLSSRCSLKLGAVVYGRIPLMLTERCFIKDSFGCERCESASLTDRRGVSFPLMREHQHRNLILNSAITYMADKQNELSRAGVRVNHFLFTTEGAEDVRRVIKAYRNRLSYQKVQGAPMRRIGKREARKN